MEYEPEMVVPQNDDGVANLARFMSMMGTTTEELCKAIKEFTRALSWFHHHKKHPHVRHKQIERARAMMERGQKGK